MKKDLNILLIDTNRYHAILVEKSIKEYYPESTVRLCNSGKSALRETQKLKFDIAIIDYHLPDYDGIQMIQLLRNQEIEIPIVITTSHGSEQTASEAINSGAAEYIVKDISYHQTIPRILREVYRRHLLIQKNREMEEKLKETKEKDILKLTAGTLLHEINNPLMTILGITELILEGKNNGDNELIKKIRIIMKSAKRIQSTLNRLTHLSKPLMKETVTGKMVDPQKSKIYSKSKI